MKQCLKIFLLGLAPLLYPVLAQASWFDDTVLPKVRELETPALKDPTPVDSKKIPIPKEGPKAVLAMAQSFSGPKNPNAKCCTGVHPPQALKSDKSEEAYPKAKPIPLKGLENIVPLTRDLWSREHILKDFEKNKKQGQEAILVFIKSEHCHSNPHGVCSVATAALEKQSTPLLKQFRIYGSWIKSNPEQQQASWTRWEEQVAAEYRFEQGPGAKIVVIVPGLNRVFESNAGALGLTRENLEKNKGKTPHLERFLSEALESGTRLRRNTVEQVADKE